MNIDYEHAIEYHLRWAKAFVYLGYKRSAIQQLQIALDLYDDRIRTQTSNR